MLAWWPDKQVSAAPAPEGSQMTAATHARDGSASAGERWYTLDAADVAAKLAVDPDTGLSAARAGPPGLTLPKRQKDGGYVQPDLPLRHIPTPF